MKAATARKTGFTPKAVAIKAVLDGMPGALADGKFAPKVLLYKIAGKMFAILSIGKDADYLNLKCDPHLAEMLRERYDGVGRRGHLDPRFWIAIDLNSDVPAGEVRKLVAQSYDLVRSGLTRKQQAGLAAVPAGKISKPKKSAVRRKRPMS